MMQTVSFLMLLAGGALAYVPPPGGVVPAPDPIALAEITDYCRGNGIALQNPDTLHQELADCFHGIFIDYQMHTTDVQIFIRNSMADLLEPYVPVDPSPADPCGTTVVPQDMQACPTYVDPNCMACNSNGQCTACASGYYLDGDYCYACLANCEACSGVTSCLVCSIGYFPSGPGCEQCPENCAYCTTSGSCDACSLGYTYDAASMSCIACGMGCALCNDMLMCEICNAGYYQQGNDCYACQYGCDVCDSMSCLLCGQGYYHEYGSCTPCTANCEACYDASSCDVCSAGYTTITYAPFCIPMYAKRDASDEMRKHKRSNVGGKRESHADRKIQKLGLNPEHTANKA